MEPCGHTSRSSWETGGSCTEPSSWLRRHSHPCRCWERERKAEGGRGGVSQRKICRNHNRLPFWERKHLLCESRGHKCCCEQLEPPYLPSQSERERQSGFLKGCIEWNKCWICRSPKREKASNKHKLVDINANWCLTFKKIARGGASGGPRITWKGVQK